MHLPTFCPLPKFDHFASSSCPPTISCPSFLHPKENKIMLKKIRKSMQFLNFYYSNWHSFKKISSGLIVLVHSLSSKDPPKTPSNKIPSSMQVLFPAPMSLCENVDENASIAKLPKLCPVNKVWIMITACSAHLFRKKALSLQNSASNKYLAHFVHLARIKITNYGILNILNRSRFPHLIDSFYRLRMESI